MGNPNPSPSTRFGGARAPARGPYTRDHVELVRLNAAMAAELRHLYLGASLALARDAATMTEGDDPLRAARDVRSLLDDNVRNWLSDADKAAGVGGHAPPPAPEKVEVTDRQAALALMEVMRRGLLEAQRGDQMKDITPDD